MIDSAALLRFGALCAAAIWGVPAAAADEDVQFWIYLKGSFSVADNVSNTTEISPRWREGSDIIQLRTTFETEVADGFELGAGGAYIESGGNYEIRPHQQLVFSSGRFSARTRFEQRFAEGADRVELRLRQNVQFAQPIAEGTRAHLTGEALYTLQNRDRAYDDRNDQWRGEVGLQQRLNDSFSLTGAYRAIYTPRDNRSDTLNHVAILTLSWKP
ncbi:DUF2490 domain-containing protein [Aurantiacibacter suaedae]|uniref:DUF2490 domain-containing protein n=1 Tax=Aurantiacibacter suaedae TaxID=2545755 RepID=UPI0010FA37F9|nr:DUF2490 domain-containing protein [Aurantiacibacter suaedae]